MAIAQRVVLRLAAAANAALLALISAAGASADDFALGTNSFGCLEGQTDQCGLLVEINLTDFSNRVLTDTGNKNPLNQPNAQAWDHEKELFYYADAIGGEMFVWEKSSRLHHCLGNIQDFVEGDSFPTGAGEPKLDSATFYRQIPDDPTSFGEYYFIPSGTDALWKATLKEGPPEPCSQTGCLCTSSQSPVSIDRVTLVKDFPSGLGCMRAEDSEWGFGDIAINSDGLLYGIGKNPPLDSDSGIVDFFSYDLNDSESFRCLKSGRDEDYPLVQLAFNAPANSELYAFNTDNGQIFTVDLAEGPQLGCYIPLCSPGPPDLDGCPKVQAPPDLCPTDVRFRDTAGSTGQFPVELQSFSINDE